MSALVVICAGVISQGGGQIGRRSHISHCEEDAWKVLEGALENQLGELSGVHVVWKDWPALNIHLPNVPEDGTISSSTMAAILELQKALYRTHALLATGSDSLRTLSRYEREQFELRLKVEKGSSDLSINLSEIISKYGNDVIAKMSGNELLNDPTPAPEFATSRGWLVLHESGTFVKLTKSGADLFA